MCEVCEIAKAIEFFQYNFPRNSYVWMEGQKVNGRASLTTTKQMNVTVWMNICTYGRPDGGMDSLEDSPGTLTSTTTQVLWPAILTTRSVPMPRSHERGALKMRSPCRARFPRN